MQHSNKTGSNPAGAGKEEGVNDFQIGTQLPDSQKDNKNEETHKSNHSVMLPVIGYKAFLGRGGKLCRGHVFR